MSKRIVNRLRDGPQAFVDAAVERNSVLPEKTPPGGPITLRDGDPGEPEQALGGFVFGQT